MSAPTLWEEGRWSATRVTRFSSFALIVLTATDVFLSGRIGLVFDAGFVVVCLGAALAVRPADFFRVGVLPPLLLLGLCAVLSVVHRTAIAPAGNGLIQGLISGLAHHAGSLFAGYALCLIVLAIRQRVLARHGVEADLVGPLPAYEPDHWNLDGSPAPYRTISGAAEVKSTTVVGSDPDSPARTASTR